MAKETGSNNRQIFSAAHSILIIVLVFIHFTAISQCNTFITLSASDGSSFGIGSDGSLWAWGDNKYGRLGDGTKMNRQSPVHIMPGSTWKAVSAGVRHTAAIRSDGTLWAWGLNTLGQVDETGGEILLPKQIDNAPVWNIVSGGSDYTIAIKTNGTLWSWGYNGLAGLGNGTLDSKSTPQQIDADTWTTVSAGAHCLGIKTNGTLWAWGINYAGQLGDGTTMYKLVPTRVGTLSNWQAVSSGHEFSVALTNDGMLWTWGSSKHGKLGDGTTVDRNIPAPVTDKSWQSVSAGDDHVLGVQADGTLWAWGDYTLGRLGRGRLLSNKDEPRPVMVGSATDWNYVEAGDWYSLAAKTTGRLWSSGWNNQGQLANGGGSADGFQEVIRPVGAVNYVGVAGVNLGVSSAIIINQKKDWIHDCVLLASIESKGPTPISGNTAVKVWIESDQPQRYLRRHYEISPEDDPEEATGRVTLYFTQEDFALFNAVVGNNVYMPRWSADHGNKANILIEKRGGKSSDGSGLPHTYTGPVETINPNDNDIVWNDATNTWEVSFDTEGFSGFFVKNSNSSLPVTFGYLNAFMKSGELIISWQTLSEKNNDVFIIEASADGKIFREIGKTRSSALNGSSDVPIHYRFQVNTANIIHGFVAGIGLISLFSFGRRRRRLFTLLLVISVTGYMACNKQSSELELIDSRELFIRITQVDKDGTRSFSKVVKAEGKY